MPSWPELTTALQRYTVESKIAFISQESNQTIRKIADLTDRNVLYYASAFLQKPTAPTLLTAIMPEDINGFMAGVKGCDKEDLLLILHTPGGMAGAAQTIVEYLRDKFARIDVAIPAYAMSAGTMIALGCDCIIMDRQSQLGPIDSQVFIGGRHYSAHSIVGQFETAKADILKNPALAHAWMPILRSIGPALLQEAQRSNSYGRSIVKGWLEKYMFCKHDDPKYLANETAKYFSSDEHKAHGKRIGRDEARTQKLEIRNLEEDQELQDSILTLYHLSTIAFENAPAAKIVHSSAGGMWVKNWIDNSQAANP